MAGHNDFVRSKPLARRLPPTRGAPLTLPVIEVAVEARAERPGRRFQAGRRGNQKLVWIIGVVIIVVIGAAVAAIFLGGGEQGPFLSISRGPGTEGKVTSSRGRTDYQDGLRKPPNENELL